MTLEIRLREEATEELAKAASWYERQLSGLGQEFLDMALALLESIPENPTQYPIVHKVVRRALLPRFPFGIYYSIEENFILVYGVMHASRNPSRWQDRT
ncbi:MAG: plasmid stabilization protein [SAR86 cluster bacterium]|uniref:Plasmid stabilization protein n=1 Tax=SAR86 cluster bacterium TaxID=2030880 RepID=A0A2A5CHY7_9GAMM|nr:type II toxin-antitoxin system RelE/ParE family toxin [Gammaproteobacteria bacterium AH-315-E17]PCJ43497.1 MAG: plasmid stabilization protein [SAR86 cluster bacterium]